MPATPRGNEPDRLTLMRAHRGEVIAKIAEGWRTFQLIDHEIVVWQGLLAVGDADEPWAPVRTPAAQ